MLRKQMRGVCGQEIRGCLRTVCGRQLSMRKLRIQSSEDIKLVSEAERMRRKRRARDF